MAARLTGRARPQPVFRRGWKTDVVYWFMTALITSPIVRVAAVIPFLLLILAKVTTVDVLRLGQYQGFGPLARQPVWLQAVQIYLLADLAGYWTHLLFHRGKWWPFHAVHHSSEELDPRRLLRFLISLDDRIRFNVDPE